MANSLYHVGLTVIKETSKTILEMALEHYISNLITKKHKISSLHIDEICKSDNPIFADKYTAKTKGYYSLNQAMKKIESSNTLFANNIKQKIKDLYNLHVENNSIISTDTDASPDTSPIIKPESNTLSIDFKLSENEIDILNDTVMVEKPNELCKEQMDIHLKTTCNIF